MAENRKVILINRKFQLSVIGWFSLVSLITTVIYFVAMNLFFTRMASEGLDAGLLPDHVFFRYLEEQQALMTRIFLIGAAASVLVILLGGLWLSHRVAGPIHRLVSHMRAGPSDVPLKFRKDDYFPEIEEAFNEFIKK